MTYDERMVRQANADREAADLPMFRQSDPETSRSAAEAIAPHVTELQHRVLDVIRRRGPSTAKELEQLPDFEGWGFSTVRKRVSELATPKSEGGLGLLVEVGVRERSTIYELAERAKRQ